MNAGATPGKPANSRLSTHVPAKLAMGFEKSRVQVASLLTQLVPLVKAPPASLAGTPMPPSSWTPWASDGEGQTYGASSAKQWPPDGLPGNSGLGRSTAFEQGDNFDTFEWSPASSAPWRFDVGAQPRGAPPANQPAPQVPPGYSGHGHRIFEGIRAGDDFDSGDIFSWLAKNDTSQAKQSTFWRADMDTEYTESTSPSDPQCSGSSDFREDAVDSPKRLPLGPRHTLMVRNIPAEYTQDMLLDEWPNTGTYNFLYLPLSSKGASNLGYAFINFTSEAAAEEFWCAWDRKRLSHYSTKKPLNVTHATVQGLQENLDALKHKSGRLMRARKCRPLVFVDGLPKPFEGFC